MTKTAVIAMIVFGCSLRVLAEDAAATAAAAAGGAMNAAAADGHISTIKFIHSKNTAASWKSEGQDEQSHPVDRGYTMYGQISAHFPANRLCRFRFEPMDYLTVMHSDHLLKMWHYGIDGAPADPNARWSVPTILALPVPPTPFSWIWFRSGNTPLPELHSLAEFNDATTSAWFVNPAEKSDAKLYVKMYDGLLIKLEDPYVDSVVNLHALVEGETVSGIIDGIAQVDALRYQHVGFFVDGVSVGSPHLLMADPPYGWRIDTTKLSDGPHVIEARSHEPGLPGAYRSSGKINIKVDNSKPAVSLLQFQWIDDRNGPRGFTPWPWSSIGGPVPVKAAVANMKAVGKVEFLMDSTVMETDTSDPYEATIDSTKFKDGPHEMTVKAYDAAGNPAASQTKKVFVLNHFTIKVMTPSAGETVSGTVTATASTSEGYRCRYLKFLVDGVCMGEDNDLLRSPYFALQSDLHFWYNAEV